MNENLLWGVAGSPPGPPLLYLTAAITSRAQQSHPRQPQFSRVCFRRFNGRLSAHGKVTSDGSPQIQDNTAIANKSKTQAQGNSRAKGKRDHCRAPGNQLDSGPSGLPRGGSWRRGRGRQRGRREVMSNGTLQPPQAFLQVSASPATFPGGRFSSCIFPARTACPAQSRSCLKSDGRGLIMYELCPPISVQGLRFASAHSWTSRPA